jgi:hypothetical protein
MTERLQYDFHPDADQISAFVEQALPEHERMQMLDHLAVCAECRAIVALSLPAVEDEPKSTPQPARKPWWSGWVLAWPAAGALAAAAFVFIYIYRAPTPPNRPSQQQVAVAQPPQQPGAEEKSPGAALRQNPDQPRPRVPKARNSDSLAGAANSPIAEPKPPVETRGAMALTGRNVGTLAQSTVHPEPATGSSSGAALGQVAGGTLDRAASPGVIAQLKTIPPSQPAGGPMPAAPPRAASPAPASTVMAQVSGAEPIQTESATVSSFEISADELKAAPIKHRLPSRLSVLSTAAQGERMIAIDTHNAVFLSSDSGKHWKAIQSPWQGRAVKATLAVLPVRSRAEFFADKAYSPVAPALAGALSSNSLNNALPAADRKLSAPAIEGTVTDPTGAVIAGASIVATDTATGTAHHGITDRAGHFALDDLPAGNYRVEAQATGFKKQELAATVGGAAPTTANLMLEIGAASQTVTVQAAASAEIATQTLPPAIQQMSVFEITTESGEHWTSPDGVTWTRR